jgi:hypothetical protein
MATPNKLALGRKKLPGSGTASGRLGVSSVALLSIGHDKAWRSWRAPISFQSGGGQVSRAPPISLQADVEGICSRSQVALRSKKNGVPGLLLP